MVNLRSLPDMFTRRNPYVTKPLFVRPVIVLPMRRVLASLFVLLPLTGCLDSEGDPGETSPRSGDPEILAPWWPVGAWWDVEIRREGQSPQSFRVVHFWNDTETNHFWLGVADRSVALDHALHDTNPLLGRVHWNLLTPHEKGIHAHGMYTFPVKAGDAFDGLMFGREWNLQARAGDRPGTLKFAGASADGASIAYDYDPASMWFTFIEIRNPQGTMELEIDVKGRGLDEKGTYWFLRGRDYYLGPERNGSHDELFDVETESPPLKTLALEINGRATGPLRIEVKDPANAVRHSETLALQSVHTVQELDNPTAGTWRMSYVGTGDFQGTIEAVGIVEYTRNL